MLTRRHWLVSSLIAVTLQVSKILRCGVREGVGYLRTAWLRGESSCQGSASSSEFLPLFRPRHHPRLGTAGRRGHQLKEITGGSSDPEADSSPAPPHLASFCNRRGSRSRSLSLFLPPSWFRVSRTVSSVFAASLSAVIRPSCRLSRPGD